MNIPKNESQIVFWQESTGYKPRELLPCPAIVVGVSEPICAVCREKETGHARPNRRHAFTALEDPGLTLDVTYINGEQGRRYNVQLGKLANCWTETEVLPVIHGVLKINLEDAAIQPRRKKG